MPRARNFTLENSRKEESLFEVCACPSIRARWLRWPVVRIGGSSFSASRDSERVLVRSEKREEGKQQKIFSVLA